MTEGRPHRRAKSAALDALTLHFRSIGRTIYVADALAVVHPGEPVFSPDLLAVRDVPQPDPDEDERMAWVVADEGKGPDLLMEVLYQGNRDKYLINNVRDYARLGVREYFVYDRLRFRLHGYRLARPGAGYQELSPRLGQLTSEVLGLDLALVGRRLRFFSGMAELPSSEEVIEQLSKMIEARAQQAEAQAQQAEVQVRDAVLDLAEAYGLKITPERRQQVQQASLEDLAALRAALKAGRSWP
jgi:Uma2 family endonuclease